LDGPEVAASPSEVLPPRDEALTRLTAHDPVKVEAIDFPFFALLTMPERAQTLGLSPATAEPDWTCDRLCLHAELAHTGHLKKSEKTAAALRGLGQFRRTLDNDPCPGARSSGGRQERPQGCECSA
jgi:hypothetical protein